MEGAFFGSIIFEAIGAFFRWIILQVFALIKGRKPVSFMRNEGNKRKEKIAKLELEKQQAAAWIAFNQKFIFRRKYTGRK